MSNKDSVIRDLIKIADVLDSDGKLQAAKEVDATILALSSKKSKQLKDMSEDVRKDLIAFIHDADKSVEEAHTGLVEFSRRLRYFDLTSVAKEIGIDKTMKEVDKIQKQLLDAKKKFYKMLTGKEGSVAKMTEFLGESKKEQNNDDGTLGFFDKHYSAAGDDDNVSDDSWEDERESDDLADFWEDGSWENE